MFNIIFVFLVTFCGLGADAEMARDVQLNSSEAKLSEEQLLNKLLVRLKVLKNKNDALSKQEVERITPVVKMLMAAINKKKNREVALEENEKSLTKVKRATRNIFAPIKNVKPKKRPKDPLYSKGLVFKVDKLEDVHAPADGTIIYAQKTAFLKYIIILETPDKRLFTLTGVDILKVDEGAAVKRDEIIGQARPNSEIYIEECEL